MTSGGPLNSTISMSMYTYKQFGFGNYGYAASMSYLIFVDHRRRDRHSSSACCARTPEADHDPYP